MKIEVNISKRYFFILASILVLGFLAVGVSSYGGSSPSIMGHSGGEIEVNGDTVVTDAFCNKIIGGNCGSVGGGVETFDLVNGQHSSSQCTAAGGAVVDDGLGNDFCRFNAASCHTGWAQYNSWSTTTSSSADCYHGSPSACPSGGSCVHETCTTSSHSWMNKARESCTVTNTAFCPSPYCISNCPQVAYATVTQIGCY